MHHHFAPGSAYDLSTMHTALPINQTPQVHSKPLASWATDFIQQQPLHIQEVTVSPTSTPAQYSSPGMSFWGI